MSDFHQELMNQAYAKWKSEGGIKEMGYNEFVDSLPKNERCAVLLGNLNYQVCNGGWSQWCHNGYCTKISMVRIILLDMNTEMSARIVRMIDKVMETLKPDVVAGIAPSWGWGGDYFANMEPEEEECWNCHGDGTVSFEDDDGNDKTESCPECGGDGYITTDPQHPDFDSLDSDYYTFNDAFMEECQTFLKTL